MRAEWLLTPDREVRPGSVEAGPDGIVRSVGGETADGAGGVLLPGFVDLQCNGAAGADLADCTDDAFRRVADALLRAGVTAWCPTLPSAPQEVYPRFLDAAAEARGRPGPRVIGVHLEGPFLNPARGGAHSPRHLRAPDARWLETLLDRNPGLVRVVTLAPELPGAAEVVALCVERGVTVCAGHSDATAEEAEAAFDAGVSMLTHLFNAMRPLHHRDAGLIGAALARPDVHISLICDGVHVLPGMATFFARGIGPERLAVVSDAIASPSLEPLDGGFVLMDGALRNLVAWGFPLRDAVRMLTATPADAVGERGLGRLEPGSAADAVLWREGAVAAVWMEGEEVAPPQNAQ